MEIQILKENLTKAMQAASKFTSSRVQMPILAYVLIEAKEEGIFITATNLDVGLKLRVAGKILKPGAVAVSAKVLAELVQHLPLGGVTLKADEQDLKVQAGKVKARLKMISAAEFPPFPDSVGKTGEIKVKEFNENFGEVGFAVSTDEARPVLTGLLWLMGEKGLVATDGYRLSIVTETSAWETAKKMEKLLVPGKAISQLLQLLTDLGAKACDFYFDEKTQQLLFSNSEMIVSIRTLAGDFPQYEAILPKNSGVKAVMLREELLEAVRAAAIFARDSANIVKLSIKDKSVEVSANAAAVGENVVEVEAEVEQATAITIAFNAKYIIDFLTHTQAEKIGMGLTDVLKPGLFWEVGNENYKHVIMPVRVRE